MSSGFITESEILEARRIRQEEWDKVRTEDQPTEAPEEPCDNRPLYQRLEEQRLRKEAEFEEAHKLKNMIRGLDDDEVGFLDLVESAKAKAAQQISIEERKEMQEFRERVSTLAESEEMSRLRAQLAPARNNLTPAAAAAQNNKNKLHGVVVRKRKANEMEEKQEKGASSAKKEIVTKRPQQNGGTEPSVGSEPVLVCVGVLPGLGNYDTDTSTDTDDSSDIESTVNCCTKRDLLGRRAEHSDKGHKEESKIHPS